MFIQQDANFLVLFFQLIFSILLIPPRNDRQEETSQWDELTLNLLYGVNFKYLFQNQAMDGLTRIGKSYGRLFHNPPKSFRMDH